MKTRLLFLTLTLLFLNGFWGLMALGKSSVPSPTTSRELQKMVQQEFQEHNYKKVIRLYEDFTEAQSDAFLPLTVRVLYSQSLADTGELEDAIQVLREILAEFTPEVDALLLQYNLANLLFMERRYQEARAAYQKALLYSSRYQEIQSKARERLNLMKDSEGRKKDTASLQLIEIETSLEAGEVPDGAEALLKQMADQKNPNFYSEQARRLLAKVKEVRTKKAGSLLDEARRLFDEERKYLEVREILEQLARDYSDVCEIQSVEVLRKEVDRKLGPRP